jgi:hypothetical protein
VLDPDVARLDRDGDWLGLTTVREKFEILAADAAFRESWQIAVEVLGDRAMSILQRIALVTIRPEAVLTGQVQTCLDYLERHDFEVGAVRPMRYHRLTIRDVWRYQWNVASLDSMRITDLVHRLAPAVLLVLFDRSATPSVPAACRFTGLKGTSRPDGRRPEHLRSVLGAPNQIMVMVHAPDEPMDLVRELGVLFGQTDLFRMYNRFRRPTAGAVVMPLAGGREPPPSVAAAVAGFHQAVAQRRWSGSALVEAALDRANEQLSAAQRSEPEGGVPLDWRSWAANLSGAGFTPTAWPYLLIGSQYVRHSVAGAAPVIPETGRRRWLAGQGRLVSGDGV